MNNNKVMTFPEANYLKQIGIQRIEVNYSGGGDSGAIDDVFYVGFSIIGDRHLLGVPEEIHEKIIDLVDDQLMTIGDWYNNDGGKGIVYIDIPSLDVRIDATFYYPVECDDEGYEDYDNQESWDEEHFRELPKS